MGFSLFLMYFFVLGKRYWEDCFPKAHLLNPLLNKVRRCFFFHFINPYIYLYQNALNGWRFGFCQACHCVDYSILCINLESFNIIGVLSIWLFSLIIYNFQFSVGLPKLSIQAHTLFLFFILDSHITCDVLTPLQRPSVDNAAIALL